MPSEYGSDFYAGMVAGSLRSAAEVLPLILDWSKAKRVIDVGCGPGAWAKTAIDFGVESVIGVDGAHVPGESLLIPPSRFFSRDLAAEGSLVGFPESDLAICLEVAEHLPAERADSLVAELAKLAPMILFSAAIPFQGGTNHVNEQWPSYWVQRFGELRFRPCEVRHHFWTNPSIESWYRQNMLLLVREGSTFDGSAFSSTPSLLLDVVHPDHYTWVQRERVDRKLGFREVLAQLPRAAGAAVRRRVFHRWSA